MRLHAHSVHSTAYMHVSFLCMMGVYAGLSWPRLLSAFFLFAIRKDVRRIGGARAMPVRQGAHVPAAVVANRCAEAVSDCADRTPICVGARAPAARGSAAHTHGFRALSCARRARHACGDVESVTCRA